MVEMHGRFTPSTAGVSRRCSSRSGPNGSKSRRRRKTPWRTGASGRRRICRSRPASARTRWKTCAAFIEERPRRRRAGGPDALRRLPRDEAAGRVGRRLQPADGAAQRVRSGGHDGESASRGGDAQLQGARTLQRLRRRLGARPGRPLTAVEADGCFGVPERPGLGLSLDRAACAAHPRTGGRIRLFEAGWEQRGFGTAKVQ